MLQRLVAAQSQHIRESGGKLPRSVILSSADMRDLLMDMTGIYMGGLGCTHVLGMEIVHRLPREFCKNCGAPTEPNRCSYCGTHSELMEMQ